MMRYIEVLGFVLLILVFAAEQATATEFVVVASTQPDLVPGEIIDGTKPLALKKGASVTLISGDGKSITLRGPQRMIISKKRRSPNRALLDAVSKIVAPNSDGNVTSLGVVRGSDVASPDDAWRIDVSSPGNHCVRFGQTNVLWRPLAGTASKLSIRRASGGEWIDVDWPSGISTVTWPDRLAIEDGGTYLTRLDQRPTARKLTIHILKQDLPSRAHRAVWLAERGCRMQARFLLSQIR